MSFSDQLASDAQNVFLNADEWAETVKWRPSSGGVKSVAGVVMMNDAGREYGEDEYRTEQEANLDVAAADVTGYTNQDTFTIRGTNWAVMSFREQHAMVRFELARMDREHVGRGHREAR